MFYLLLCGTYMIQIQSGLNEQIIRCLVDYKHVHAWVEYDVYINLRIWISLQEIFVSDNCIIIPCSDLQEFFIIQLYLLTLASLFYLQGLRFIQGSPIRSHGNLKSRNCVIDSRWVLKLTDFGMPGFRESAKMTANYDPDRENSFFFINKVVQSILDHFSV